MVQSRAYLGALLAALPSVRAGFNASSTQNIAVYWGELNGLSRLQLPINTSCTGQNSANQETSQQRLSTYCASKLNIDLDKFMKANKYL